MTRSFACNNNEDFLATITNFNKKSRLQELDQIKIGLQEKHQFLNKKRITEICSRSTNYEGRNLKKYSRNDNYLLF